MKIFYIRTISICLALAFTNTQVAADPTEQPDGDAWFCERGEQNKEWVCIESETIIADTAKAPIETTGTLEPVKRDVRPLREMLENVDPVPEAALTSEPTPTSETEPETTIPVDSHLPLYVQLSHKPGQAINISKLPPEFYVVQLMSLTNKSNLESYFGKHKLMGLSAARVESNDAILYVLLLGIYENFANAKQASENMPVPLQEITPWIRSLDSLQKAMLRADDLTGSRDY